MSITDPIHYQLAAGKIAPIDFCRQFPFAFGNFAKYVLRAPYKGSKVDDLKKALWYLELAKSEHAQFQDKLDAYGYLARCFNNEFLNLACFTSFDAASRALQCAINEENERDERKGF